MHFILQLQRHFQADTLPRIERLKQKEQGLQRRLLRVGHMILLFLGFSITLFIQSNLAIKNNLFDIARGKIVYQYPHAETFSYAFR